MEPIMLLIYRAIQLFGTIMLGASVGTLFGTSYGTAVIGSLVLALALYWEKGK